MFPWADTGESNRWCFHWFRAPRSGRGGEVERGARALLDGGVVVKFRAVVGSDGLERVPVFHDELDCTSWVTERRFEMKPFTVIAIVVFSLVAILQLTRLILGWEVMVNGLIIPAWVSGMAFVIAGGLAVMLWRETRA